MHFLRWPVAGPVTNTPNFMSIDFHQTNSKVETFDDWTSDRKEKRMPKNTVPLEENLENIRRMAITW